MAIKFAKTLLLGAQVRAADAGASFIRFIARRYAFQLGWRIRIHPAIEVERSDQRTLDSHADGLVTAMAPTSRASLSMGPSSMGTSSGMLAGGGYHFMFIPKFNLNKQLGLHMVPLQSKLFVP